MQCNETKSKDLVYCRRYFDFAIATLNMTPMQYSLVANLLIANFMIRFHSKIHSDRIISGIVKSYISFLEDFFRMLCYLVFCDLIMSDQFCDFGSFKQSWFLWTGELADRSKMFHRTERLWLIIISYSFTLILFEL